MTDLFARFVPDAWLDRILAVIALQPAVTFQILTKRSARMRGYCARPHMGREIWALADTIATDERLGHGHASFAYLMAGSDAAPWPLDNLWLGVSVEDQTRADGRIPDLLATPAAVRFVSAEPLLGAIDLNRDIGGTLWIGGQRGCGGAHQHGGPMPHDHGPGTSLVQGDPRQMHHHHDNRCKAGLDWIIAGGESGREARPMHPAWARGLRDQCASAGVPFFFKQWGDWLPAGQDGAYRDGDQILNCSDEPVRVGKAAAGRLLDGATHDAMPALRTGTGAG
jgi:protein gp37